MANKYLTTFILVLTISFTKAAIQTVNGKIKITIGTTSACSDALNFMTQHLVPVYAEYKQFLEVEFVPWGRTRFENGNMVCQFGPNDCWANRLHRCVLNMLRGNQDAQVNYMACEFTRPRQAFELGTYNCALATGLNLIDVDFCMSTTGDALERPAQEAAAEPMAIINFVPYILINNVIDREIHNQARTRLRSLICFALADDPTTGVTNCQV
ncbi:GILT-like protein 1 [Epargyreus clarus]|uniref:GILT-like protein 1 n=1 Tax=Epargyreus clarus TaxID=520877 RepID=UPI003C2F7ED4